MALLLWLTMNCKVKTVPIRKMEARAGARGALAALAYFIEYTAICRYFVNFQVEPFSILLDFTHSASHLGVQVVYALTHDMEFCNGTSRSVIVLIWHVKNCRNKGRKGVLASLVSCRVWMALYFL